MLIYGSFSPIHIHQNLEKDKDEDKHDEISAINPLDNTIGNIILNNMLICNSNYLYLRFRRKQKPKITDTPLQKISTAA